MKDACTAAGRTSKTRRITGELAAHYFLGMGWKKVPGLASNNVMLHSSPGMRLQYNWSRQGYARAFLRPSGNGGGTGTLTSQMTGRATLTSC